MFNISVISLSIVVLIFQNILLLNEESLILLCFVTFCWIAINKLGPSFEEDLSARSGKIEQNFKSSLNEILKSLEISVKLQNNFQGLYSNFNSLGNHFFKLTSAVINYLPIFVSKGSSSQYPKKLFFTQRIEQQTVKLLTLLVSQKLNKVVSAKQFYTNNLQVPQFSCVRKITTREYIQFV